MNVIITRTATTYVSPTLTLMMAAHHITRAYQPEVHLNVMMYAGIVAHGRDRATGKHGIEQPGLARTWKGADCNEKTAKVKTQAHMPTAATSCKVPCTYMCVCAGGL